MRQSIGLGFVAVVVALLGCQKGPAKPAATAQEPSSEGGEQAAPKAAVHKQGGKSVTATIGSGGGSLELASGAKVEIPAGAIAGSQELVLEEAQSTTAFFNDEHERPIGPTFILSPAVGVPEGETVSVSIPLAAYPAGWGDGAIGFEYPVGNMVGGEDAEHTRWQYADADLVNGRLIAKLPGLNGYRLQFVLTNLEAQ